VRRRPAVAAACAAAALALALLFSMHEIQLRETADQARKDAQQARAAEELTQRVEALRELLSQTDRDVNLKLWDSARIKAAELRRQAEAARQEHGDDPRLMLLAEQAQQRFGQIELRLPDDQRRLELARLRGEAGCQAAGPAGLDPAATLAQAERRAHDSLRLFQLRLDDGGPPLLDGGSFSEAQKQDICEGLYEVLLHLAEAAADPRLCRSDEERRAQAGRALEVLTRADRLGVGQGPLWHGRRARYLSQHGDRAEAEKEAGLAEKVAPQRAFEFFLRGSDLYRAGREEEAAGDFEEALRRRPDHLGARYVLAVCRLRRAEGRRGEARQATLELARDGLTLCLDSQPDAVWPRLVRGYTHGELGDFGRARDDYQEVERLLDQRPDDASRYGLLVNRGMLATLKGDFSDALHDLERAMRLRPDDSPAYLNLAEALRRQGRLAAAEEELKTALDRPSLASKARAALLRFRARMLEQRGPGFLAAARGELEKIPPPAADPADKLELARLLVAEGRFAEALTQAEAVPDDASAQRLQAEALAGLGRHAEAARALGRALEEDRRGRRTVAAVYQRRGHEHARAGDPAAAAEDFTQALALDPDDAAAALAGRGAAYQLLEAYPLALRDYERLVRLRADDADAYAGRGYARARLAQTAEDGRAAVADADEALRRAEPTPQRRCQAARILAQASLTLDADALRDPRARAERDRLQGRALGLVREAVEMLPPAQRSPFWNATVQPDAALNPLRGDVAFRRLAAAYAAPTVGAVKNP
jgi:tetratricopeptide (TPR) repeat protein